MDEKRKIRLDSTEEELVDLAIGYTAACGIFVVLHKGMECVKKDTEDMQRYIQMINAKGPGFQEMTDFERGKIVKGVQDQKEIADLALRQSNALLMELQRIIKEMEPVKQSKVQIIKPNWNG